MDNKLFSLIKTSLSDGHLPMTLLCTTGVLQKVSFPILFSLHSRIPLIAFQITSISTSHTINPSDICAYSFTFGIKNPSLLFALKFILFPLGLNGETKEHWNRVFKGFRIDWPGLNPSSPYGKIIHLLGDSVSFLIYNMKITFFLRCWGYAYKIAHFLAPGKK